MFQPADFADLYPFKSNFLNIQHSGRTHRLHYLDEGPRTRRALLMVHGNPTWSFYYRNLALKFRDRFRCIVPDHLGCGLSDKPQDYPYRLADHIANVRALLDHLQIEDVALIAHDWGGAIGTGVATSQPDRFSKFVWLNTAAFRSTRIPFRIAICRWPLLGAFGVRGLNGFAGAALTMASEKGLSPRVKAGLIAPYDSWANRVAIHRFVQDIPMSPSHPSWSTLTQIEEKLPTLAAKPKLLCWGMKDWCFSPHFLDRWLEFFPQAEVQRIEDAGHYVLEDAGDKVAARIDTFLR